MKRFLPWLLVLLAPLLLAMQFTEPAPSATYTGNPVLVNFTWDEAPVFFALTGQASQVLNVTNTSVSLSPGSYTATIANTTENSSDNSSVSFTVQAPISQNVTVSVDQATYEVLSAARIRVTVSTPSQLNLVINRDGSEVDSYTLNVQQQTDFLYTVSAVGAYTVVVTGDGASASTQFTVQNTTLGVALSGPSTATVGRIATYASTVSGGTAPFTYYWEFSDNTTSTQATAAHVFATAGNHTVQLVVHDAQNRQASATKTVTVTEETYRLLVTVAGENNRLLKGAVVTVTDNRSIGRSGTTDNFGDIKFKNLTVGNYTVAVSYNDTVPVPAVAYTQSLVVSVTDDTNVQVNLSVPDHTQEDPLPAPEANNTTVAETPAAAVNTVEPLAQKSVSEPASSASFVDAEKRKELETKRSEKLTDLHNRLTMFSVSDEKQRMVTLFRLQSVFDAARTTIEKASSIEQLEDAMATVPKDIAIVPKDTTVLSYKDVELGNTLQRFYEARGITDDAERKKYKYSVEQILDEVTVTTKRSIVHVIGNDGQTQNTYTVFERSGTTPSATTLVEFIPKTVARDATYLHVDGSHEVLDPDPVLRFLSPQYTYYVVGDVGSAAEPVILPVPIELQAPPGLIGLVSAKLNLGTAGTGGLLIVLIGALLGVVVAGNVLLRKNQSSSTLSSFTELGDLALSTIAQGNYETVAKYAGELKKLHSSLSPKEQALTAEIMTYVEEAHSVHNFRTATAALRTVISLRDVAAVSGAYERVMQQYESLCEQTQAREQQLLTTVNQELEAFVAESSQ